MSSIVGHLAIRAYLDTDWQAVRDICIEAFTPIYVGFARALGPELFSLVYPDWKSSNESYLRSLCETDDRRRILVAELDGTAVGFIHYEIGRRNASGKLGLNAVHSSYQGKGIATQMYARVFELLRAEGMKFAQVSTGGDEAHIAARGAYEKSGFTPIPVVHYFKKL
ncbi:MAG: GNAT family N-acetyltransferase [Bryobacterales bacterium]|nr:GNAT family N-acetyltransferase [Bryobacterales bacterium]